MDHFRSSDVIHFTKTELPEGGFPTRTELRFGLASLPGVVCTRGPPMLSDFEKVPSFFEKLAFAPTLSHRHGVNFRGTDVPITSPGVESCKSLGSWRRFARKRGNKIWRELKVGESDE